LLFLVPKNYGMAIFLDFLLAPGSFR